MVAVASQSQLHIRKYRLAVWFSLSGDIRFLSHRDTMRLWRRAAVRALLPIRYSQGFNPHIRLTLPLPRSVGVSAECELLIMELTAPVDCDVVLSSLRAVLPVGIDIVAAGLIPPDTRVLPELAHYSVKLSDRADLAVLAGRITEFEHTDRWPIRRQRRGRHPERTIDLRDSIGGLEVLSDGFRFTVKIHPDGTARLDEFLSALDIDSADQLVEITRTAVVYAGSLSSPAGPEIAGAYN